MCSILSCVKYHSVFFFSYKNNNIDKKNEIVFDMLIFQYKHECTIPNNM